ncbi:MAG: MSMEG_1061 family FMN-dependent PPOX-type flavoprotein [Caulobacterales bacterium]
MTPLTLADLTRIYPQPKERARVKALKALDRHAMQFIELSPFCVLASVGGDGTVDVSPKGGEPGFAQVASPTTILLPDRMGNNRLDGITNVLSSTGEVSVIFFIPGVDETLRVAGRAALYDDPALLEEMAEFGKPPRTVLEITVRETFLHCAKALMRSKLWSEEAKVERGVLPSMGEMIRDQTGLDTTESLSESLARYRTEL